jgi:flagellar hook-basal body complex protein FliE
VSVASVTGALAAIPPMPSAPTAPTVGSSAGDGFGATIGKALDQLQASQAGAEHLARQAAVGGLQDPSELMIAATQASLATELTVAVRNKAVEAFNSIMSMGI